MDSDHGRATATTATAAVAPCVASATAVATAALPSVSTGGSDRAVTWALLSSAMTTALVAGVWQKMLLLALLLLLLLLLLHHLAVVEAMRMWTGYGVSCCCC